MASACTSNLYAGPIIPQGSRRGPQYQVKEPEDDPLSYGGAAFFTPPQRCAKARRLEQHPRLPRLWICPTHQHRQCATCAAVGRGVRPGTRRTPPPPRAEAQPKGGTHARVWLPHTGTRGRGCVTLAPKPRRAEQRLAPRGARED